jgi:hypothetical protein
MEKTASKSFKITGGLTTVYILIYSTLTLNGSYQPAAYDLRGVMWYEWSPLGFYDSNHPWPNSFAAEHAKDKKTGGWNKFMMGTFFPLWILDKKCVHNNPPPTS